MPLALSLLAPKTLKPEDRPGRALQPGEARVAVAMAGVCGTDLAIWSGNYPVPLPLVLGHEWAGRVIEINPGPSVSESRPGSDKSDRSDKSDKSDRSDAPTASRAYAPIVKDPESLLGKRVTGEINNTCLARAVARPCEACRRGFPSHCLDRTVTGIVVHDGAFQRELVLPWRVLHVLPDSIPDDEAIFIEPLAAAIQTFELTPIGPGDFVVVLGAGRLGSLAALVAKAKGARVLTVMRSEVRATAMRALGLETFRLAPPNDTGDHTGSGGDFAPHSKRPSDPLAPAPSPLLDEILSRTGGFGADVVVETTGSPTGLPLALDLVRPRGTIALKSTPGLPIPEFAVTRFVVNEVRLQGSRCGPFDKAIEFQAAHRLPLRKLVVDTFDLSDLDQAMVAASNAPGKVAIRVDTASAGSPRHL